MATTRLIEILRGCYSHVVVAGRDGSRAVGVTNLKRIWGRPEDLRVLAAELGRTVGRVDAIASADTGSAPLAAVVAYELGLPSVFVRDLPKEHLLSYGGDPATNDPRLFGERLRPGSTVHVIDDLVHTGASLAAAAQLLTAAGLVVEGASCLLVSPEETGWRARLAAAGVDELEALAETSQL